MELDREERNRIIEELKVQLNAKVDGTGKNLNVPVCPYCGHLNHFGIYIGKAVGRKKPFMGHCFHCGKSVTSLEQLLKDIGRPDLIPSKTVSFKDDDFSFMDGNEIDDSLEEVDLPEHYKRTRKNAYLKGRGFTEDDYDFFPCGTTRFLNFKFDDYVIFPIIEDGVNVGYVSRITMPKFEIEEYNRKAKLAGKYQKLRYKNSTDNEFSKLLYNIDSVVEGETDTVIITEGIFDTIALTRKLGLYDYSRIVPVATFGKKISEAQAFKLQNRGVKTIVIGYDSDAMESISKTAEFLSDYFDVYIAWIENKDGKDWDEMNVNDIYDVFSNNLYAPIEFKLNVL